MLKFRTKVSYGIGGVSDNTLYTLTGTYLLLYLTTVAGVSPAVAGTISAIGSVWESIIGPIIGFKSDGLITRFGRRKPFMIAAAFPIAIVTSLLFTTINAGPGVKVLYYGVMIVLFWTFFAMEFVPYLSWGADLTDDYNERTVLRSFAYVFNQVGMLVGMVLPTIIVDYALNLGKTTQQSWQLVGIICGFTACMSLLLCTLTIHQNDISKEEVERLKAAKKQNNKIDDNKCAQEKEEAGAGSILSMLKEYLQILKLRPILSLIGASMLYLMANTIFSSDRVFYMTYNLGMSQSTVSLLMLIITVSGVVFVPFLAKFSAISDKKEVFKYGIGVSGVLMIASTFIDVEIIGEGGAVVSEGMNGLTYCIFVCLVYSLANTCYWQLMPSMIYDVCEVEELKSGASHSGAVISLQALSESVCIALGLQTLGIALDFSGFNESFGAIEGISGIISGVQPESALLTVSSLFTVVPGIFMILSSLMMLKYPLDKKTFEKVRLAVEKRRKGEEPDMEGLEKLIK